MRIARLRAAGGLTEEQTQYLRALEESSARMVGLINNVIGFLESENPLHSLPGTGVTMMKGRCYQRVVGFEEQVIRSPGIATDAVHRLFVGSDGPQAVEGLLIQLGDVPMERVFVLDREILEPADLTDRE